MKKAAESSLCNLTQFMPPVTIDYAWVAKQAEAAHVPDTRLHLRDLTGLEQQRGQIVYRIEGRKKDISGQAPLVSELRRRATAALEELTALTESHNAEFGDLRGEIKDKQREADRLESQWASESKLLAAYENILTTAERNLKEFDKANGEKLKRLREMSRKVK